MLVEKGFYHGPFFVFYVAVEISFLSGGVGVISEREMEYLRFVGEFI